jgi:hypothetical protein
MGALQGRSVHAAVNVLLGVLCAAKRTYFHRIFVFLPDAAVLIGIGAFRLVQIESSIIAGEVVGV